MVPLLEFRAGLMRQDGSKLVADPRRGLVRLVSDDGLPRLHWHERAGPANTPAPAPELDVLLLPGKATLARLGGGGGGARVFKLTLDAWEGDPPSPGAPPGARTLFFWPQEPNADGDEGLVSTFNARVEEAGLGDEAMDADGGGDESSESDDSGGLDLPPGPIGAAHLAAALAAIGMPPPPAAPTTGSGRIDASALASALAAAAGSGGGPPGGPSDPAAAASALRALARAPGPSLAEVLRPDALRSLLTSEDALAALAPHLPEGHRSMAGLLDVLSSAQWRSQLNTLSSAFTTSQLDLAQFGLRAAGFTVADFLQAVQDAVDEEKRGEGGGGGAE